METAVLSSRPSPSAPESGGRAKLALVMDFIFGSTGGTENQVLKLINHLDRRRFELELLCLHPTPWLEEHGPSLPCRVLAFGYDVFSHRNPRNLPAFWKLVRHLRRSRPQAAVTFFKTSYILGVAAARLAGVPRVISTRRDYGLWMEGGGLWALRRADRFVDGFVANSEKVRELALEKEGLPPDRVIVIHNGIEARLFEPPPGGAEGARKALGIGAGRRVVGITAGLRPMKRHETFLRAAAEIARARGDVDFLVVGDGPRRGELQELTAALGLAGRVVFAGWREDTAACLAAMDVGVNCSANEGLSNAVMEYMAAGIPAVVSDAGGNPELVTDGVNGLVFPLDDAEGLAARVLELLEDGGRRDSLAAASRARIRERFSLEGMISAYDDYFTRLIAEARKD